MINKELLTAVLGPGIYYHISIENGVISWNNGDPHEEINIYEFAHKCKLWALTGGFEIIEEFNIVRVITIDKKRLFKEFISTDYFDVKTFFMACQWIINQNN
jgi:hypothetical protein